MQIVQRIEICSGYYVARFCSSVTSHMADNKFLTYLSLKT